MKYDAFISYSHSVDDELAPALQRALHRFAKPWYKRRALRVFRDKTSLTASPGLWSSIETALDDADHFILLASPESAQSQWVQKEVEHWLAKGGGDRLIIALTDGDLHWSTESNDFDWAKTNALPKNLEGKFKEEPLWVDLREVKDQGQLSRAHPAFRAAVIDIAAVLHKRPKDEIAGEDVRQHRRTRRIAWSAGATLTVLLVASIFATVIAVNQRRIANEQRAEAENQRQVAEWQRDIANEQSNIASARADAAEAMNNIGVNDARALALAVRAAETMELPIVHTALDAVIRGARKMTVIEQNDHLTHTEFAANGFFITGSEDNSATLWDPQTGEQWSPNTNQGGDVMSVAVSADGKLIAVGQGNVSVWDTETRAQVSEFSGGGRADGIAFDPSGTLVAVVNYSNFGRVYDARSGKLRMQLGGHARDNMAFKCVATSPDTRHGLFAVGSSDGSAKLFSWQQRSDPDEKSDPIAVFRGHAQAVTHVEFSRDGRRLLIMSRDRVRVWSIDRLRETRDGTTPLHEFLSNDKNVEAATSGGNDHTMVRWDNGELKVFDRDGAEAFVHNARGCAGIVEGADLDPNSSRVAIATQCGDIEVWPLAKRVSAPLLRLRGAGQRYVHFSPDGNFLATQGNGYDVNLWASDLSDPMALFEANAASVVVNDASNEREVAYVTHIRRTEIVGGNQTANPKYETRNVVEAWNPRGVRLHSQQLQPGAFAFLNGGDEFLYIDARKSTLALGSATSGKARDIARVDAEGAFIVASPDGQRAAVRDSRSQWQVVDVANGGARTLQSRTGVRANDASFSHDGSLIATPAMYTIEMFETSKGRHVQTIKIDGMIRGHRSPRAVRFHPSEAQLMLVEVSGKHPAAGLLRVSRRGEPELLWHTTNLSSVSGTLSAFNADGTRAATVHKFGEVKVWRTEGGDSLFSRVLPGELGFAAFDASGENVVTASMSSVWLVNIESGAVRQIALPAPTRPRAAITAQFTPDGRGLVTLSGGVVRRHPLDVSVLLGQAKERSERAARFQTAPVLFGDG